MKTKITFLFLVILFTACHSLKKADSIMLKYDEKKIISPGTSVKIGIEVITSNQKKLKTKGLLKGNTDWSNFNVNVTGGNFTNNSIFIDTAINYEINREVLIVAGLKIKPELMDSLRWQISYDNTVEWNFNADNEKDAKDRVLERVAPIRIFGTAVSGKSGYAGANGKDADSLELRVPKRMTSNHTLLP